MCLCFSLKQVTKFLSTILPTWAGFFEKFLSDGREYLAGDFTVADIAAFHYFSEWFKVGR